MAVKAKARAKGRPPKGKFANLSGSPLSLRMPPELRSRLEKAAKESGSNLSQQALSCIERDMNRSDEYERDPATFALAGIFNEIVNMVAVNAVESQDPTAWRRNAFAFKAVRLAFDRVMQQLQPPGDPDRDQANFFGGPSSGHSTGFFVGGETPEKCAEFVATLMLMHLKARVESDPPGARRGSLRMEQRLSRAWKALALDGQEGS